MTIKYSPEVKKILKAAGWSDAQIKTAEVKSAQEQKKAEALPEPQFKSEEEQRRFEEKFGGSGDLDLGIPRGH